MLDLHGMEYGATGVPRASKPTGSAEFLSYNENKTCFISHLISLFWIFQMLM